jgi:hypothetical protein
MNAMSFFEKISGLQRKREEQQDRQYSDVVSAIAMGTEPDPEEVDRILSDADKTLDELKADVAKAKERISLQALDNSLPTLTANREKIAKQIQALDSDFEKAERAHDEARLPLENRLRECDEAIREANMARSQLVATCEDSALLREQEHVDSEMRRLAQLNRDLLGQAVYYEDKADTERNRADREIGEGDRNHRIEQAKAYLKEAKKIRERIKANEKLSGKLERQRDGVQQRMREQ